MKPRPYQEEAINAAAFELTKVMKTIIVAPTASGKSVIQAEIIGRFLSKSPGSRALVLCHQGHLLTQNEERIHQLYPDLSLATGIYCASEKRKETKKQIILASRDSLGRNPEKCGKFSLCIVDEAHLIDVLAGTEESNTFYSRIFKHLGDVMIVGLTGTPWRLDGGLVYGESKFFDSLSYEIKMGTLIDEGFLCPYILPKNIDKLIDASSLKVASTGDFKTKDLDGIATPEAVIKACIDQWEILAKDRTTSLFFCCSVDHAKAVEKRLNLTLNDSSKILYIDGSVTGDQRKEYLENLRLGKYKAVINIGVLTTGFDAPIIDCIVLLRPTASAALFVQCIGRGLRTREGKENCLVLDMAGNFERFGSVENPIVEDEVAKEKKEKEKIEAKERERIEKTCAACGSDLYRGSCNNCGYVKTTHSDEVFTLDPKVYTLRDVLINYSDTKAGDVAAIVMYIVENSTIFFKEWLLINREFRGKKRAIARHDRLIDPTKKLTKITVTPNLDNPRFPKIEHSEWQDIDAGQCKHLNVERIYSDTTGQKTEWCADCEEVF